MLLRGLKYQLYLAEPLLSGWLNYGSETMSYVLNSNDLWLYDNNIVKHYRRRWTNVKPTLIQRFISAGMWAVLTCWWHWPHSVRYGAVSMQPYHLVLLCHVMQEGMLVVCKECVRHPDFLSEVARQRHTVAEVVGKGQPLVLPVLVEVDSDGVVLEAHRKTTSLSKWTNRIEDKWKAQIGR